MPLTTNSDSEDDYDYAPPEDDPDSDSSNEQDGAENTAETETPTPDLGEQKKKRDALWASFQATVSTPQSNVHNNGSALSSAGAPTVNRIKVERMYLFAGKHVAEIVEVAEDSEEAKKWPRWLPHLPVSESGPATCPDMGDEDGNGMGERPTSSPLPPTVTGKPNATTVVTTAPTPSAKPPGARKPRMTLPSIPKTSQTKKISTLDKSVMDWRAHVASQSSDVKHELDANRRGGGYLEKVDFLKRVEDRREDVFEANRVSKRRKT